MNMQTQAFIGAVMVLGLSTMVMVSGMIVFSFIKRLKK